MHRFIWFIVAATLARDTVGCLATAAAVAVAMLVGSQKSAVVIPLVWSATILRNEYAAFQTIEFPDLLVWADLAMWLLAVTAYVWPRSSTMLLALFIPLAGLTRPHKLWDDITVTSALYAAILTAVPLTPQLMVYAATPLVVACAPPSLQITALVVWGSLVARFATHGDPVEVMPAKTVYQD